MRPATFPVGSWAGIRRPPGSSPLLVAQAELLEQRLLEVAPGQPYLLRPDGSLDDDVIRYCNSESFRRLALRSQIGYAYDLRAYLSFLELRGVDWRVATGEDLVDYEYWRRQDPGNPQPISAATFTRELAGFAASTSGSSARARWRALRYSMTGSRYLMERLAVRLAFVRSLSGRRRRGG